MNTQNPALKIERYKTVKSQHQPTIYNLSQIIEEIQTSPDLKRIVEQIREASTKEEQTELKKHLPVFRPCVSTPCHKPHETNGIIQLDVDDYDFEKSKALKQLLTEKVPSLLYVFLSPKGGLKLAVLSDLVDEDSDSYKEAYCLTVEQVEAILGKDNTPEFDDACKSLSQLCYLSSDVDIYFCDEPEKLQLTEKVKNILKQKAIEEEKKAEKYLDSLPDKSTYSDPEDKDVGDALAVIPRDYRYDERLPVNFAVFSHFGYEGIHLLFNHWITADRKKLQKDLQAQLKSHDMRGGRKSTVATLFAEAKKYGYSTSPPRNTEKAEEKGEEPTYPVSKLYTPAEASEELEQIIDEFIETKVDTAVLFEAGAGKTWGSLKKLNEELQRRKMKLKVVYFVNTKAIAQERKYEMVVGDNENDRLVDIPKIIEKLGGGVSVMKGYGKDTCPLWKEGDTYNSDRCDNCRAVEWYGKLCPYEKQYLGYRQSSIDYFRLYQHAHLFQPSKWDGDLDIEDHREWKPDLIVVDEDVVSNMIEMEYVKKGKSTPLIDTIITKLDACECTELSNIALSFKAELKKEVTILMGDRKIEELSDNEKALYEVMRVLLMYAQRTSIPQASVWLEDSAFLYVGWVKRIHHKWVDVPMLYLDASGNEKIISRVLRRKFKFHKIRCHYQPNVEVVQVQNNTVSKGWCDKNRDKLKSFIELMEQKPTAGKTGFISYKNVKSEPFISELVTDENTCGWYGKLRGSNQFKGLSQLIVFGRHFIPTEEMIRIAKVVFRNWDENWCAFLSEDFVPVPLNDAMRQVQKTIRMKDGKHKTLKTSQYIDYRLHELSEHLNQSETYQALHRLRLVHGNDRKQLVYVSKDVNDITVDRMVDDVAVFITGTRREFVELVFANDGKVKLKSNKQIAELIGKTVKQVAKMKENNKEWMEHNIFFRVDEDGYCVAN